MEINYVVGNVRTQLLEVGIIAYIVDTLWFGDDTAKTMSFRAIITLFKYGAQSIPLNNMYHYWLNFL